MSQFVSILNASFYHERIISILSKSLFRKVTLISSDARSFKLIHLSVDIHIYYPWDRHYWGRTFVTRRQNPSRCTLFPTAWTPTTWTPTAWTLTAWTPQPEHPQPEHDFNDHALGKLLKGLDPCWWGYLYPMSFQNSNINSLCTI